VGSTAFDVRYRLIGRGTFLGGFLLTVLIHGALVAIFYFGHMKAAPPADVPRDILVTKLVTFGKPRPKYWLPRAVQVPKPEAPTPTIKLSEDLNAAPAQKEAPRPDDANISKDLKRALDRARSLAKMNIPDEPPEGALDGSDRGTSNEASAGDAYATKIFEAVRKNWSAPTGLVDESTLGGLAAEIRLSIGDDGELINPRLAKSSGNQFFDDSCMQAIKATARVPPPPATERARFRRGLLLEFAGKDLAR
jgi:TonB family protein